jgi:acyl-CoA thioesterase I
VVVARYNPPVRRDVPLLLALVALAAVGACAGETEPSFPPAPPAPDSTPTAVAVATQAPTSGPASSAATPLVVFLGDSLTAGLGLGAEQAFPALVAAELEDRGTPIRAVNAGVSGDTSAGGLRRIDWLVRQRPDVVVVALGANDALRGQPAAAIEANLRQIVQRARAAGAEVLLVGIQVPPSYGDAYARAFAAIYPRLAAELDVPLLPFLLEGVAGRPELNLPDGIHPNDAGHRRIAAVVATHLQPLVVADRDRPTTLAR